MTFLRTLRLFIFLMTLASGTVHAIEPCEPLLIPIRAEGDRMTLDGADIDVYAVRPLHSRGRNHDGMFRSTFRESPVLLKRLDAGARAEAIKSGPGRLIGGPRIFGVARFDQDGAPPLEYVVIEEFFAGQPSSTFQGLIEASSSQRSEGIRGLLKGPPDRRLTRQLADGLARGLVHDILPPFDLDFIMTKDQLRLIDAGSLSVGRLARQENPDRFFVHAVLRVVARSLEIHLDRNVSDAFRADFLASLRALVEDEGRFARIERTADEVYGEDGHFLDILKHY